MKKTQQKMGNKKNVEIMAPAGSYESLMAAIKAGADSVYFGIGQLNMRARSANNFALSDLKKIAKICRKYNKKSYLTLNTIIYDEDLQLMKEICDTAKKVGITAMICMDIAALSYAHSIGLEAHMSTQANISNIEAVRFYAQFADVVVLARELTLKQIKKIVDEIKKQNITGPSGNLIRVELFIHGALCVSISGKCYMSLATYNLSANRGVCLQNCRRAYLVIDEETGDELKIENRYVMSPKDLCTIAFMGEILNTGVSVLKIEGRGRSPEYVYTTVKAYREAAESYFAGAYTKEKVDAWIKELEKVFNRGFWHGGYYLGKKLGDWSGIYGSKAAQEKKYLGTVKNYFSRVKIGEFRLEAGGLNVGDEILITGPTTGIVKQTVKTIFVDGKDAKSESVQSAKKGARVTVPVAEKIRENDKLFVLVDKMLVDKKK
ncbi:MAG: peptidase U32 family protein [Nanoarchaeota archaeon]